MTKDKLEYRKDVAFINREQELKHLRDYINIRPESILFLHGPKSSGKTTLLYKFLEQIQKEQKMDVKFMNLRETFTNVYEDFLKTFFQVEGEKKAMVRLFLKKDRADIRDFVKEKIKMRIPAAGVYLPEGRQSIVSAANLSPSYRNFHFVAGWRTRHHPETNENQHHRTAQHRGSSRRGVKNPTIFLIGNSTLLNPGVTPFPGIIPSPFPGIFGLAQ